MKILNYQGTEHLIDKIYDAINSGGSADYIVEQGTSGIWTYEKWASGKAVCWGRLSSASTTATYVNLNGYIPSGIMDTTTNKYINASGGFSGVPDSHIGYCRCSVAGRYDIYIYRSATLDRVADIDVTIRGFWKEFTPSVSRMNPKKGTFTCTIPRLANQNVTFNYTQVAENILVATAEITANTSSDGGRLYLYFEGSPSGLPFTPLKGFGGCECNDVCYSMATSQNKNLWIGGLTGTMASGRYMTMRFILIG